MSQLAYAWPNDAGSDVFHRLAAMSALGRKQILFDAIRTKADKCSTSMSELHTSSDKYSNQCAQHTKSKREIPQTPRRRYFRR